MTENENFPTCQRPSPGWHCNLPADHDGPCPAYPNDRILWNKRDKDIDEIVLHGVDVHIEQMDDRCWWIGLYREGVETYWMGNFVADKKGRMRFVEQENAGIQWSDDRSHE